MPISIKNAKIRLTAAQIRAARGILDWTGPKLAEATGLSLQTIRRMESAGPERSTVANVETVRRTFEDAGVVFIDADETAALGPGLRLKL